MTRRALFGFLAAAAADPERLLWEPGKRLISIPAPAAEMIPTWSGINWVGLKYWLAGVEFTVERAPAGLGLVGVAAPEHRLLPMPLEAVPHPYGVALAEKFLKPANGWKWDEISLAVFRAAR
jgi:hypothetical protein